MRGLLLGALLAAAGAAHADVVVIVHPHNPTHMGAAQVAQIYLGRLDMLKPVDQLGNTELRAEFYRKVAGMDLAQVKAAWSKLIFTGRATPPRELTGSAAVKRAVAADLDAIGYIERADLDSSVRVLLAP